MAQVFAAHRISSQSRIDERLLPLFWVLDRIKKGQESGDTQHFLKKLSATLPKTNAERAFRKAMDEFDGTQAEIAIVALARSVGTSFKRVQCTPDLLPSDVTGGSIFNQRTAEFEFRPGPRSAAV